MPLLLLQRKISNPILRTKFTGVAFYSFASHTFSSELFSEDGLVKSPGDESNEVNIGPGFAFPAFRDGHTHPLFAGREAMGPVVTKAKSIQEIQTTLRAFREANPNHIWIEGGAYDRSIIEDGLFLASWIDEVISDVPVVLHASDHHTIWVNTKALGLIPSPIPAIVSGSIDVDSTGSPQGVLREPEAMALVLDSAPPKSMDTEIAALVWADKVLAGFGIVEAQDAWITPGMTEVYLEAVSKNLLLLDYNLAFKIEPHDWKNSIEFAQVDREKVRKLNHPGLSSKTVKLFADGVFGSGTASVLEPYLDDHLSHGEPLWTDVELQAACLAASKLGFQLHIHAIGDAGVRQALDAIEYVQLICGKPNLPSVIAHVELINTFDIARFSALGVVANMQPLWAQADGMLLSCVPRLGQARIDQMYRMRDLIDSGAAISFGSDWPVSSSNPILGIATAVTRQTAEQEPAGGWVPTQAITIAEAFGCYTEAVSFQLGGQQVDPLGNGQPCDFVVLDRNPFETPVQELREIKVLATYKRGKKIF